MIFFGVNKSCFHQSESNDFDGQIDKYRWVLGDGKESDDVVVHTCQGNEERDFTVTLTVTDNSRGIDVVQKDITIKEKPSVIFGIPWEVIIGAIAAIATVIAAVIKKFTSSHDGKKDPWKNDIKSPL